MQTPTGPVPARFKQADIRRAIKAVEGMGYQEVCVSIAADGKLEVIVRRTVCDGTMGVELD